MSKFTDMVANFEKQAGNQSIYVWGGQGELLKNITDAKIRNMETNTTNANRAIAKKNKTIAAGKGSVARIFDCSGLVCVMMEEAGFVKTGFDTTAHELMRSCGSITRAQLQHGDWVGRKDSSGKHYHIGFVIEVNGALYVIEAMGRDDGVVKRTLNASGTSYWNAYGRPKYYTAEKPAAASAGTAAPAVGSGCVQVLGGGVNVRKTPKTGASLEVVKKGDKLSYLGTDATGWFHVKTPKNKTGYISNRADLTRLAVSKRVQVLGAGVNVRTTGSTAGSIIGIAKKGQYYEYLGKASGGWYQINFGGKNGYISNKADLTKLV